MLPAANRLKKQKDFKRVYAKARSYHRGSLTLKALDNDLGYNRFGLVISSTTAKKAVTRNRLRRQLSEIIRERLAVVKDGQGFDIILIIRPSLVGKSFGELGATLDRLFKEAKLMPRS